MGPETVVVHRLSQEAYQSLTKVVPGPSLPKTEVEAGFLCGVEFVMKRLREGFVVERGG